LRYLQLLREGHVKNGGRLEQALMDELLALEKEERDRIEKAKAEAARLYREKVAEIEAPEAVLEDHWAVQRQYGKEAAANRWAERYGVPLPTIIEVAETEEEMREALRKLRNASEAKKYGPMKGMRPGGAVLDEGKQYKKPKRKPPKPKWNGSYRNGKPVF